MKQLMDEQAVNRTLMRMAHQIVERNPDVDNLCVVGVRRRGATLARCIAENIRSVSGLHVDIGELDISLYRDDLSEIANQPNINRTDISFSVQGQVVVIVDDVLFTGRTARAAMDAIIRLGRPACIQLAVLVDRGHRELPIRGDFVGKNIPTSLSERIAVKVPEFDGITAVEILQPQDCSD